MSTNTKLITMTDPNPYPGNLKHHKVSPAMERTIPEVYRAALATLESLIEDVYDHAKERQRKLLCEMMKDDAKSGLYDTGERPPLLSDDEFYAAEDFGAGEKEYVISRSEVRDVYEAARVKDAELIQMLVDCIALNYRQNSIDEQKMAMYYAAGGKSQREALDIASSAGFKPTEP